MNTNNFKQRVIHAGARCLGTVAAGLLAALALGAQAAAQDCPNVRTFGERTQRGGGPARGN
jgi:hypothetical protein